MTATGIVSKEWASAALATFVAGESGAARLDVEEGLKDLAKRLRDAFEGKHERRMTREETEALVRYLAGEALAVGAFSLARTGGALGPALDHVRRWHERGKLTPGRAEPLVASASDQDGSDR